MNFNFHSRTDDSIFKCSSIQLRNDLKSNLEYGNLKSSQKNLLTFSAKSARNLSFDSGISLNEHSRINLLLDPLKSYISISNTDKIIDQFLACSKNNALTCEKTVRKLLDDNISFNSIQNLIKYYTHLNSWRNDLTYSNNHPTSELINSEGWESHLQIPIKLKHILLLIDKISKNLIECHKSFNEPKEIVEKKLREEIYNQITTFYTAKQHLLINDTCNESLREQIIEIIAFDWCKKINQLKPSESYSVTSGCKIHCTYMDFKKQTDGNLSVIIYNLGGGSDYHPVSLNNKIYPYVVENIPSSLFNQLDDKAIDYIKTIISAKQENKYGELFFKVYDSPFTLGGVLPKNLDGFVAMKYQISSNCSVKNNQCALRNRLKNDKLFKFIKNFEIGTICNSIEIPALLITEKELEKDSANLNYLLNNKFNHLKAAEEELFRFLQKRTKTKILENSHKPGDRVGHALLNLSNPDSMKYHIIKNPNLLILLDKIAALYESETLRNIAINYSKSYTIKPKRNLESEYSLSY